MNTNQKSLTLICDSKRSSNLANEVAKNITPPQLIELVGDLGGGKTAFTKALGKSLGVKNTITSPTFNIHRSYQFPKGTLEHFDLYRLSDDQYVLNELNDCLQQPYSVVVVEWAQNFSKTLSADRLVIGFEYVDDTTRKLTIESTGPKSKKILEALR